MASYYVRSGAGGAGTGADWANAYTTMTAAVSGKSAGDIFYVSEDHSESTAGAVTITFPGTNASPNFCYCVNHSGSVPPVDADLRTTGQVATSGNNSITVAGTVFIHGVKFVAGNSTGNVSVTVASNSTNSITLVSCLLQLGSTGSTGRITVGTGGQAGTSARFRDCTFAFSNTSQGFQAIGTVVLRNSTFGGSAIPDILFLNAAGRPGAYYIEGCDLSAFGAGKTLFEGSQNPLLLKDSKLGASVSIGGAADRSQIYDMVNCDSGDTNYRSQRVRYEGTLTTEITIVRTGGASNGVTTFSWKIVTTANSKWIMPFEAPAIAIWNDTIGVSVTATVEGIWGGGAVPNNDEIWIDAQYLGTSGFPVASHASGSKASNLASASALTSSAASWGGSTTPFKMTVTFTAQEKGWVYIYPKAATASTTFYVDPKVTLS